MNDRRLTALIHCFGVWLLCTSVSAQSPLSLRTVPGWSTPAQYPGSLPGRYGAAPQIGPAASPTLKPPASKPRDYRSRDPVFGSHLGVPMTRQRATGGAPIRTLLLRARSDLARNRPADAQKALVKAGNAGLPSQPLPWAGVAWNHPVAGRGAFAGSQSVIFQPTAQPAFTGNSPGGPFYGRPAVPQRQGYYATGPWGVPSTDCGPTAGINPDPGYNGSTVLPLSLFGERLFPPAEHTWYGFVNEAVKAGNRRTIGEGSMFLPLGHTENTLVFADLRAKLDDHDGYEANCGLGV